LVGDAGSETILGPISVLFLVPVSGLFVVFCPSRALLKFLLFRTGPEPDPSL